jgi:hypothetical protein
MRLSSFPDSGTNLDYEGKYALSPIIAVDFVQFITKYPLCQVPKNETSGKKEGGMIFS